MTGDPNSPEILASVPNDIEAASIAAQLSERGILASTTGGFTAGFRAEAPGSVHVIVRRRDLAVAQKTLALLREESTDVDWLHIDVGEPDET